MSAPSYIFFSASLPHLRSKPAPAFSSPLPLPLTLLTETANTFLMLSKNLTDQSMFSGAQVAFYLPRLSTTSLCSRLAILSQLHALLLSLNESSLLREMLIRRSARTPAAHLIRAPIISPLSTTFSISLVPIQTTAVGSQLVSSASTHQVILCPSFSAPVRTVNLVS